MTSLRALASVFGDKITTSLEGHSVVFPGRISGAEASGDRVRSWGEHCSPLPLMCLSHISHPSIHPQSPSSGPWLVQEQGERWSHRVRSSHSKSPSEPLDDVAEMGL